MVFGGEGHIDIKALADLMANYTLFKTGNKLAGAERQRVVFSLAAFKCNTAGKAFIVDHCGIPQLGLGVLGSFRHTGVAVGHCIQFRLYVSVGDLIALTLHLQALVFTQCDLRLYGNFGDKGIMRAVHIFKLHFRIGDCLQSGFLQRLLVGVTIAGIDGVLIEVAFAHHLVNNILGSLALAETVDIQLGGVLLKGSIQRLGILFPIHGDVQFVKVGVNFFGLIQFHLSCPPANLNSSKSF